MHGYKLHFIFYRVSDNPRAPGEVYIRTYHFPKKHFKEAIAFLKLKPPYKQKYTNADVGYIESFFVENEYFYRFKDKKIAKPAIFKFGTMFASAIDSHHWNKCGYYMVSRDLFSSKRYSFITPLRSYDDSTSVVKPTNPNYITLHNISRIGYIGKYFKYVYPVTCKFIYEDEYSYDDASENKRNKQYHELIKDYPYDIPALLSKDARLYPKNIFAMWNDNSAQKSYFFLTNCYDGGMYLLSLNTANNFQKGQLFLLRASYSTPKYVHYLTLKRYAPFKHIVRIYKAYLVVPDCNKLLFDFYD